MRMDCHEVADRMAAWLDAELSPSEAELFARHLEDCPACAATMRRMEAQVFPRMPLPDTGVPGFWDRMDAALAAEASAPPPSERPVAVPSGWLQAEVRLPRGAALLYAALLLLSLGLASWQASRASAAGASLAELEQQVEREQRLAATPRGELPVEPVGLVSHTPYRGSL